MKVATFFLKKLKKMLFSLVQTRVIIFIIANLAVFLLVELSELIRNKLKTLNDNFKIQLYTLESFLFTTTEQIFSTFENVLTRFKEHVQGVVDTLLADTDWILRIINFTAWFDLFMQTMIASIKSNITALVTALVNPIYILTGNLSGKLEDLNQSIIEFELTVTESVHTIYETLKSELTTLQTSYNSRLTTFFDTIRQGFDWYNEGVNAIEAGAGAQIVEIEAHNTIVENIIAQIEAKMLQEFQPGKPGQTAQIEEIISDIRLLLDGIPGAIDVTPLNIDYSQYEINIISPEILDLALITTPLFDNLLETLHQDVLPIEACLIDLQTGLQTIRFDLEALPEQVKTSFINQFPAILRSIVTDELTALITLALTKSFMQLQIDISNLIHSVRSQITANKTDITSQLQVKATEFVELMETKEQEMLKNLPSLIKPSIERYIDAVVDKVEQANEAIIADEAIQPDDFIPDIDSINSIMNDLPKIKPLATPIKKDSRDFTIQDVYRILCNNFSRNERLALMFALAPEDLQVSLPEMGNLMLELERG